MLKTLKKIQTLLVLAIAFSPAVTMAQIFSGDRTDSEGNVIRDTEGGIADIKTALGEGSGLTGTEDLGDLILKYVNFSLPYLTLAAFVGFVYAGFLYVTAYGNDEQVQKSKKIMIYAAAGIILVILSFSIVQLLTGDLIDSVG